MIHVGVSSRGKCLEIESQAHRKGYIRPDYFDKCPANNTCTSEGANRIQTKFDVERISNAFNGDNPPETKIRTEVSKDAAR